MVVFKAWLQVVGVRHVLKRVGKQFFTGIAQHIAKLPIHIKPSYLQRGIADADGRALEGSAEMRFALLEGLLKLLPLVDVGADTHPFADVPLRIKQGNPAHEEEVINPISAPNAV